MTCPDAMRSTRSGDDIDGAVYWHPVNITAINTVTNTTAIIILRFISYLQ
jgi:hypothetical protein